MALAKSLNINGTTYEVESLNSAARMQIENIEGADAEIVRLQRQLALAQTARNAYISVLSAEIQAYTSAEVTLDKPTEPKKARKTRAKV
jgi:hypothetical protein